MSLYYDRVHAQMTQRGATEGVENASVGDLINAIVGINDPDIARGFFVSYVDWLADHIASDPNWIGQRDGVPESAVTDRQKATWLAQQNIGWAYGEGMTQQQVDTWAQATEADGTCAKHPSFGTTLPRSTRDMIKMMEDGAKMAQQGGVPWKGQPTWPGPFTR